MLETKIAELTKAITLLTERLDAIQAPTTVEVIKVEQTPEPIKETPKKAVEPVENKVTADQLRDLCMSIVRADRSKKGKIKELMNDKYNANVVDDIPEDNFAEFKTLLESI